MRSFWQLRIVRRTARKAGINKRVGPHTLRHAFITAALVARVLLRDVSRRPATQIPAPICDTTAPGVSLDHHASDIVSTFSAGSLRSSPPAVSRPARGAIRRLVKGLGAKKTRATILRAFADSDPHALYRRVHSASPRAFRARTRSPDARDSGTPDGLFSARAKMLRARALPNEMHLRNMTVRSWPRQAWRLSQLDYRRPTCGCWISLSIWVRARRSRSWSLLFEVFG